MSRAKVWFVGGGPGAPDLLTVRAARVMAEADIVIWGAALLTEAVVADHARAGAELMPWPPATMADIYAAYDRAKAQDLVVARLFWATQRSSGRYATRPAKRASAALPSRSYPASARSVPWPPPSAVS